MVKAFKSILVGAILFFLFYSNYTHSQELQSVGKRVALRLEPGENNPRNSEGDFIKLKDGRLLFIYSHFTESAGDFAKANLVSRVSKDDGKTWSQKDSVVLENEGGINIMSVSLLRLHDGRIAMFYLRKNSRSDCIPLMRTSSDETLTWSNPVECTSDTAYFVLNNDRAVQLKNGRILLPVAIHQVPGGKWSGRATILCLYSDDFGKTWQRGHEALNPDSVTVQEPGVIELKNGSVFIFCRADAGIQYISYSRDGGVSWSDLKPGTIRSPLSPASIERIPSTGDLIMVWNYNFTPVGDGKRRTPLNVAVSKDEGKTWEKIREIENDPDGWYCYTAIHFEKDYVVLGHCAGNRKENNGLAVTQITLLGYDWIYGNQVINIGSRLELFTDEYLIDQFGGKAGLRLHSPEPREIVMVHDAPWEGNGCGYHSIFRDGDLYRMYYKAWQIKTEKSDTTKTSIFGCYAESSDGIKWRKPELGLYEWNGSKANNIVFIKGMMGGVGADGGHPAVFKDENPDVKPDARYKALLPGTEKRGLFAFQSPDGFHWTPMSREPIITDGAFDSQNLAFWDTELHGYRAYWRFFDKGTVESPYQGYRSIRTAQSRDFIHWHDQADLQYVDSPREHLYTNQVRPYYRARHILIGFPVRYIDRGWSEPMRALPELQHRELRSKNSERWGTALTEGLFMSSRDGVTFKRWNEAFLRPGIEREGTWNYGQQYIAWSVVETKAALEGAPNELSLYATESYWTGRDTYLRRYTLRIDGFVSVSAPMNGGEIITKPMIFKGKNLVINFSTSAAGSIQIEIQDKDGQPLPGFGEKEAIPVFGDSLERKVFWKNNSDLSSLQGKPIRIRFILKDADLYSFQFREQN